MVVHDAAEHNDTAAESAPVHIPPVGPTELHKSDDSKKRRGPVSCAECRRLKLKCDRKVPCSSCSKRGCAAICPSGTLAAGPGNRFVLADTQHLHEKIQTMSKRIVELEDALALLQAQLSSERHPLLSDELMLLKAPPSSQNVELAMHDVVCDVTNSLGTLTLGDRVHFFGANAASDYLLAEETHDLPGSQSSLPLDVLLLAGAFPMSSVREVRDHMYYRLSDWLPPSSHAWPLVETYFINAAWMFHPITRTEFVETIMNRVYPVQNGVATLANIQPHDLALLCMILAVACQTDTNRAPYAMESTNYYQLARVALSLDSVIDHPTLQSLRALELMTVFLQMEDHPNSATTSYLLLGLSAQISQSLGLHRDDTQWDLSEYERQRRRSVFWDVVAFDTWTSLALGRPPSFTSAQVDAKLPEDTERFMGGDGTIQSSFASWNHSFVRDCLLKVMDQAFGVSPLTYATVLRLDRMVREHPISTSLRLVNVGKVEADVPPALLLQRNMIFALTQKLLLYLHRSFFGQALTEHPDDPLKSQYAQSALASFRSAFYITASARALYAAAPLSLRFWQFWSQCFSSCVVLGSIVIKSPGSGLAPAAWVELDRVHELFEHVAPNSRRLARILPKLRRIREKAHEAYTAFTTANGGIPRRVCTDEEEMELRFLWGSTRLVDKTSSTPSSAGGSPHGNIQPTASVPTSGSVVDDVMYGPITPSPPSNPAPWDVNTNVSSYRHPHQVWACVDPIGYSLAQHSHMQSATHSLIGDPGMGETILAAAAAIAPPIWSTAAAMAPLAAPGPEAALNVLPERSLDAAWERFMDGIGLPYVHEESPVRARAHDVM